MRLIDADYIVKIAKNAYNEWNLAMAAADGAREINRVFKMQELCKAVKAVADDAPTIDPIHVAGGCYCRECKHYEKGKDYTPYCNNIFGLAEPGENDFCSYGELKED